MTTMRGERRGVGHYSGDFAKDGFALVNDGTPKLAIIVCCRPQQRQQRLTTLLAEAGHQVTLVQDGPLNLAGDSVLWIQGNANWFPRICRQLTAKPRSERPFVLLWHSEPLPPARAAALPRPRLNLREVVKILLRDRRATDVYTNYFRLRRLAQHGLPDLLIVSTPGRCEFLAERNIAAHWVPLGSSPSHGYDMGLSRDLDALFLGDLNIPRRRRLIKRLRRGGVNLVAVGDWSDPAYWGDNRTRLLNRTKVFLNLQRYPGDLAGVHLILGMANKALVISEPIYNPAPYVPGKHYVSATIDEMPGVIAYYLAHEAERAEIVNEGHRCVTQELTMDRSVSRVLKLLGEQILGREPFRSRRLGQDGII
jgi:glycosyl transferase family 1